MKEQGRGWTKGAAAVAGTAGGDDWDCSRDVGEAAVVEEHRDRVVVAVAVEGVL